MGTCHGESFKSYKNRVMYYIPSTKPGGGWGEWKPRRNWTMIVNEMLSPAIRFNSGFLNLPPCVPEQREVEMSQEQKHAWKILKKDAVLALASGKLVHAVNEAALRIKLIQIAAGCVYDSDERRESHELNPTSRLAEVESIIEETDRKIVIFAPLTNVLELLYNKLDRWERVLLNGNVPQRERPEILRAFGDSKNPVRICLADPACTSHGINEFVTAGVCIWYAPTDKNELYRQGIKRLDRPGQTGPVKIIQLVSSNIEREIYERLDRNESLQGLVLKFAEEKDK